MLTGKRGEPEYAINGNCNGFPATQLAGLGTSGKHRCGGAYTSHPLLLGAYGMIDGAAVEPPLNASIMNATLQDAIQGWDWSSTWGWDYPLLAFAMMRLGWQPDGVVDMLLREDTKNRYLANGHNYQSDVLPCYLPGNGGLLSAVAMMAGGYTGATGAVEAVGFPAQWLAEAEGFGAYP